MLRALLQFLMEPLTSYEAKLFCLAVVIWAGYLALLVGFRL